MNSFFNELKNQNTLAPLECQNILNEQFIPSNLSQKDASLLASISKSSIVAIDSAIGTLSHLINNLKIYKECLIDSINLQAESVDIATKYAKDIPQQVNVLPGIISVPQNYDLEAIRTDNERMLQIKDQKDKVTSQKDIYLRLSNEDVRLFLANWKRIHLSNSQLDELMEVLNAKVSNKNY